MASLARSTIDVHGREAVFDVGSHLHLARRRPWLLQSVASILATVAHPDYHRDDPRPGRERFYRRHLDGQRWLRVVVDYESKPAWIVTVTIDSQDPRSQS